jgi:hypothetical protein
MAMMAPAAEAEAPPARAAVGFAGSHTQPALLATTTTAVILIPIEPQDCSHSCGVSAGKDRKKPTGRCTAQPAINRAPAIIHRFMVEASLSASNHGPGRIDNHRRPQVGLDLPLPSLLSLCYASTVIGSRNAILLLCLFATGARAQMLSLGGPPTPDLINLQATFLPSIEDVKLRATIPLAPGFTTILYVSDFHLSDSIRLLGGGEVPRNLWAIDASLSYVRRLDAGRVSSFTLGLGSVSDKPLHSFAEAAINSRVRRLLLGTAALGACRPGQFFFAALLQFDESGGEDRGAALRATFRGGCLRLRVRSAVLPGDLRVRPQ